MKSSSLNNPFGNPLTRGELSSPLNHPGKPIVLIILDGWGCSESQDNNAIASATTPNWNKLWKTYPHCKLSASGRDVGLPPGQMGNSEVGHLTMGAGRRVDQDLSRITEAIQDRSFFQNTVLKEAMEATFVHHSVLHILGLLSPGGVHSHQEHIFALIEYAKQIGVKEVRIHCFLDGRDTPPQSAENSLMALEKLCDRLPGVRIASISGRYYAMDRDKRYERTQAVYELLTSGKAKHRASTAMLALKQAYARSETDEFVEPTLIEPTIVDSLSNSIQDHDVVIFMNFRSDRARQLSYALTDPNFDGFKRSVFRNLSAFVTLTEYDKNLKAKIAFKAESLKGMLGEFLQDHKLTQLRLAETEKYAHVTFFFNGGRKQPFIGEERVLIASPKVATYDQKPEMSAVEVTDKLVEAILKKSYDVIICNFANPDMLGHTGNFQATRQAIEVIDLCLGRIVSALQQVDGEALITADHGNAEMMFDQNSQQPHTAHTESKVPFIYIGRPADCVPLNHEGEDSFGVLADIAPTIIYLLGLKPPKEMTGHSLVKFG